MTPEGMDTSRRRWQDAGTYRHLIQLDRTELDWTFARCHADRLGLSLPEVREERLRDAPPVRVLTCQPKSGLPKGWGLRFRRSSRSRRNRSVLAGRLRSPDAKGDGPARRAA